MRSVGSMLSDGMWYAAMRKMRMNRKIATALRSDMSDERVNTGSRGPRDFRAEATRIGSNGRDCVSWLPLSSDLAEVVMHFEGRSIFRVGRGGAQAPAGCSEGAPRIECAPSISSRLLRALLLSLIHISE